MALDLAHGKRAYDLLGRHPRLYRAVRFSVCFGRERRLQQLAVAATGLAPGATVLDLACGTGVNHPHPHALVGRTGSHPGLDIAPACWKPPAPPRTMAGPNMTLRRRRLPRPPGCPRWTLALSTFGLCAMPGALAALHRVARL